MTHHFCMLSMLISDSRFDLVWFRLSCDHGWIRSGSVNVRKQQTTTTTFQLTHHTLAFDFQTANAEEHALFNISKEQQCRPTYFKYTDYSTTYHRSDHLAKKFFISKAIREYKTQRGTVYRKYPSLAKNRDSECSLMQHHASGASKK